MTQRNLLALLLAGALSLPLLASAQAPTSTFRAPVTYQRCSESWVHACGMRDESGRIYGTAHRVQQCTRWTFAPDGTFSATMLPGIVVAHGRYRLQGDDVVMTHLDDRGRVRLRQTLQLTENGQQLDDMTRLDAE